MRIKTTKAAGQSPRDVWTNKMRTAFTKAAICGLCTLGGGALTLERTFEINAMRSARLTPEQIQASELYEKNYSTCQSSRGLTSGNAMADSALRAAIVNCASRRTSIAIIHATPGYWPAATGALAAFLVAAGSFLFGCNQASKGFRAHNVLRRSMAP